MRGLLCTIRNYRILVTFNRLLEGTDTCFVLVFYRFFAVTALPAVVAAAAAAAALVAQSF